MTLRRKRATPRVKRNGDAIRLKRPPKKLRDAVIAERGGMCEKCGHDAEDTYTRMIEAKERVFSDRTLRSQWTFHSGDDRHAFIGAQAGVEAEFAIFVLKQGRWPCDVDHIVTLAEGGTNAPENLRVLCIRCHKNKTKEDVARLARLPSTSLARHSHQPMKESND